MPVLPIVPAGVLQVRRRTPLAPGAGPALSGARVQASDQPDQKAVQREERQNGRGQLGEQFRADGQQVAARQRQDLPHITETRAHHLGSDTVFFVVVINTVHTLHARVVHTRPGRFIPLRAGGLFVPIVNSGSLVEALVSGLSFFGSGVEVPVSLVSL